MVKRLKKDFIKKIEQDVLNNVSGDAPIEFIDTGSTLLNLVISGKGIEGGWPRGRIVNLIGDGSSGKTILALEFCAVCLSQLTSRNSQLFSTIKTINIIYNNVEGVMDFPLDKMFGNKFRKVINWRSTNTIEAFGKDFDKEINKIKNGTFLLYVVDSFDALTSESEYEKFQKGDIGGYHLEKQKYTNQFFRNIINQIQGRDCILFIISQVRDKIGVTFGKTKYRAGGKALDFYTHVCVWLREKEKLKKKFHNENRVYGIVTTAKAERNKIAKPFREADLSILYDYGIDDILSNVNWLFNTFGKGYEFNGKKFALKPNFIDYIIKNNLESELRNEVEKRWNDIENKISVKKERKYNV